jgi:hypothetical protein
VSLSPRRAYSDITTDAAQILTSTAANPDLQPIVEKHRPQIEEELNTIKALKTLQKTLTADKQKTTQDLQAALKRLKELVIFLRAAIRGDIGPRTENPFLELVRRFSVGSQEPACGLTASREASQRTDGSSQ